MAVSGGSMKTDKGEVALVVVQFTLLLAIVTFVDHTLVRLGLGFVVGLLLVQRALGLQPASGATTSSERREDPVARDAVSRLLLRIREFHAACHLVGSAQISPAEATERTKKIEKDVNSLLAEVVRASRGEAPPPSGSDSQP